MGKIKNWIQRIPIPAAFLICSTIAILMAILATNVTMSIARTNQQQIRTQYLHFDEDDLTPADNSGLSVPAISPPDDQEVHVIQLPPSVFSGEDQKKYSFYEHTEDLAAIIWYTVFLALAATAFYFWKIRKPFRILTNATEKIACQDLNFQVEECGQDEFGKLCQSFEQMRQELAHNEAQLWQAMEERKRLNAAFSHDLKTPLTILQGHTEMLLADIPDETISREELLQSIQTISHQIDRINGYVKTMNSIQKLEDYEIHPREVTAEAFTQLLSDIVYGLFEPGKAVIENTLSENPLNLDMEAISQICENLVSNALRYTKEALRVSISRQDDALILVFTDDGSGFSQKDLKAAAQPYYRGQNNGSEHSSHLGLGLYICDLLCQKHGGCLTIKNRAEGGAEITVKVSCI